MEPTQTPLQQFADELDAAGKHAEIAAKIRRGDYDNVHYLSIATLVADLINANASQALLDRVTRTDMIARPPSPMTDPQTQLAVAAAMCARREVERHDIRDGLGGEARMEQKRVAALRPSAK
jgi:hypothetical protein